MSPYEQRVRRARLVLGVTGAGAVVVVVALAVLAFLLLDGGGSGDASAAAGDPSTAEAAGTAGASRAAGPPRDGMTPEKGEKIALTVPGAPRGGVSTGFPHTATGAVSAAVYFWEEFAFLDDSKARQQLKALAAPGASGLVDRRISEVRTLREAVGLPPSGGTPAGVTFSTSVNAVRPRSLDTKGDVVQVWLNYDRYATGSDGGADQAPFRDEDTDLVMSWHEGVWRITDGAKYGAELTYPVAYFPTSPDAWSDGWVQVRHGD
ncbi:hypothetical protein AB0912_28690 [Streptomyces sp. NPDC007084]|uniref:hypothetical protein n=1 Tax=Streptomyces sp. NPDC007084 TaxID=3154313 RepID=UPI0034537F2B